MYPCTSARRILFFLSALSVVLAVLQQYELLLNELDPIWERGETEES